jgi:ElaB/YqjD/DUF883 family membrane-anchored ribosome-binding protein
MTDSNSKIAEDYRTDTSHLEREIEQTRSAISADLKALGEKLSPEHVKEGARDVLHEAKESAREVLRDAKEAAADSFRQAKEQALGAVSETVGELKDEARRIAHATSEFATSNAVPLALLGLGAGWLMFSVRRQQRQPRSFEWDQTRSSAASQSRRRGTFHAEPDGPVALLEHKVGSLSERTLSKAHDAGEKALHMSENSSYGAMRHSQRSRQGVMTFARDNPLAVGAVCVAVGVGVGLLLPNTDVENKWMGEARDELLRETKEAAGELRRAADHVARPQTSE